MQIETSRHSPTRQPFGAWLLAQANRSDPVGLLARSAGTDDRFPKQGGVDEVSRRLNEVGADGDIHRALEDAEVEYLSY